MAREHMPIQIGLPEEPAWAVGEPAPITYIAFVTGDEMPDPGSAFLAAGESFGVAPQDAEPVPVEDDRVAWAFAFALPNRTARVMVWCEHAVEGATPDGQASEAKWVVFIETILEGSRAVEDAVALAATVVRIGASRMRLLFDPGIGITWKHADARRLFVAESGDAARGGLIDQRSLYRVEVVANDRERGPFWITTVGLARVAKPELEMLEVPATLLRSALELVDALAARLVEEDPAYAGVPFEAGLGLRVALVPAQEACETIAAGVPGGPSDRRGGSQHPRAAICAAGKRGSFRPVWVPPLDELARLSRNETGLYLAPRVALVRERLALASWSRFVEARSANRAAAGAVFLAKIARGETLGERSHVWVLVEHAHAQGGRGMLSSDGASAERIDFAVSAVGDWRVMGFGPDLPEVGPESAGLLDARR